MFEAKWCMCSSDTSIPMCICCTSILGVSGVSHICTYLGGYKPYIHPGGQKAFIKPGRCWAFNHPRGCNVNSRPYDTISLRACHWMAWLTRSTTH